MNITAHSTNVRIATRKVRLVADAVRNLKVDDALSALKLSDKRAAAPLEKTLNSAIANAIHNNNLTRDNLIIQSIIVNEGQAMKRFHPSTRGRVHPYKRRASHITITLGVKDGMKAVATEPVKKVESSEVKEKRPRLSLPRRKTTEKKEETK